LAGTILFSDFSTKKTIKLFTAIIYGGAYNNKIMFQLNQKTISVAAATIQTAKAKVLGSTLSDCLTFPSPPSCKAKNTTKTMPKFKMKKSIEKKKDKN